MLAWNNKWRWNTKYCADSVEWCPIEPYRNVFVCGTYQLDKKDEENQDGKQTRLGCIYLFVVDQLTPDLTPTQTINTSGILDQKWCYHPLQSTPLLAAVTSEGTIQIYRLVEEDGALRLKLWTEDSIGQDILALSVDWSSNKLCSDEPYLVVSDSTGNVTLLKLCGDGLHTINVWAAHGFEAWITAFNYWNANVFYSGGDDCVFRSFDARVKDAVVTNRSHEAGVTSVRSNIEEEHQLLTGSYDESVRLWDARSLKRCLYETDVSGGVWRLKFHPFHPSYVLAACMYGGFRLLRLQEKPTVLGEYMEHDSIAYGADWKFDQNQSIAATCSFYDCSVHLSELRLEEPNVI